jgi:hypothetical protein
MTESEGIRMTVYIILDSRLHGNDKEKNLTQAKACGYKAIS